MGITLFLIYWILSDSIAESDDIFELAGLNPPVSALEACVPPVMLNIARICLLALTTDGLFVFLPVVFFFKLDCASCRMLL